MGEYIKNVATDEEIKIGVLDRCFFSRKQIKEWLDDPAWIGWYADKREEGTLEYYYNNPNSLYEAIEELIHKNFAIDVAHDDLKALKHEKVNIWQKGKRGNGYQYELGCQFRELSKICVRIVGERYNEAGVGRTIFACDCCGVLLNLSQGAIDRALERMDEVISKYLRPILKGT